MCNLRYEDPSFLRSEYALWGWAFCLLVDELVQCLRDKPHIIDVHTTGIASGIATGSNNHTEMPKYEPLAKLRQFIKTGVQGFKVHVVNRPYFHRLSNQIDLLILVFLPPPPTPFVTSINPMTCFQTMHLVYMVLRWISYAKVSSINNEKFFSGSVNTLLVACILSWCRLLNVFAISETLVGSSIPSHCLGHY